MPIGLIWQTALETPLINFLVALSALAFGSYGAAILIFTIIIRVVTFPITLRTLHSMRAMQEVTPKIQELQKRYSDPKRRTEETMKLYKEAGVNPLGCLGGQLIQIPIFIALYQVIRITLGGTPEALVHLEDRLYDYPFLRDALPLSEHFFGIDMGATQNIPLVLTTVATMWLQQRISTSQASLRDEQQRQMNQMMQVWMPLIFGYVAFTAPAGLSLYWTANTAIGIVLQWAFVGPGDFTWGSLIPNFVRARLGWSLTQPQPHTRTPQHTSPGGATGVASAVGPDGSSETRSEDGSSGGSQRGGRRRRRGSGSPTARPQPGPGGHRGSSGG